MTYRLFCLSGTGNFTSVDTFDAESDEEAIALARGKKLPTHCELWDGNRLVAQIATHQAIKLRTPRLITLAVLTATLTILRSAETFSVVMA